MKLNRAVVQRPSANFDSCYGVLMGLPFIQLLVAVAVLVGSGSVTIAQDNTPTPDISALSARINDIMDKTAVMRVSIESAENLGESCQFDVNISNETNQDFENYSLNFFFYDEKGWRVGDDYIRSGRLRYDERLRSRAQSYRVQCSEVSTISIEPIHVRTMSGADPNLTIHVSTYVPSITVN